MKTQTKNRILKELKDNGITDECNVYFYMRDKGYVDINIVENMKQIMKCLEELK